MKGHRTYPGVELSPLKHRQARIAANRIANDWRAADGPALGTPTFDEWLAGVSYEESLGYFSTTSFAREADEARWQTWRETVEDCVRQSLAARLTAPAAATMGCPAGDE